jgi:glycosyltransferase involved in cell wall biosynthesis
VVASYRATGLFDDWGVRYLVSYRGRALGLQLRTIIGALASAALSLVTRRVALLHVHSASRGSFWRKSLFCLLARALGVPYVFHIHSGEFEVFYREECGAIAQRWVRWVLRQAASVVVLTPGWEAAVAAIEPAARLRVIPNPVAVPAHVAVRSRTVGRVLFLGRLRASKGVWDLLSALPAVLARHPGARFCLAGDGDLEGVRLAARRLGVDHAVELPGWIDGERKAKAIAEAELLVLPSHYEGLPICVLEAMAAALPVVATAVGGIPFALDEGRCGVLVPSANAQALAAALIGALENQTLREQLATRAHSRAKALFSEQAVCKLVAQTWTECAGPGLATATRGAAHRVR